MPVRCNRDRVDVSLLGRAPGSQVASVAEVLALMAGQFAEITPDLGTANLYEVVFPAGCRHLSADLRLEDIDDGGLPFVFDLSLADADDDPIADGATLRMRHVFTVSPGQEIEWECDGDTLLTHTVDASQDPLVTVWVMRDGAWALDSTLYPA